MVNNRRHNLCNGWLTPRSVSWSSKSSTSTLSTTKPTLYLMRLKATWMDGSETTAVACYSVAPRSFKDTAQMRAQFWEPSIDITICGIKRKSSKWVASSHNPFRPLVLTSIIQNSPGMSLLLYCHHAWGVRSMNHISLQHSRHGYLGQNRKSALQQ